jgi:hypothetical protein
MKSIKFYYFLVFAFTAITSIIAILFVDYGYPGFLTYDMCSKTYMDSLGHPNMYDQPNSQKLIKACKDATTVFLNPIIQFVTMYPITILTMRFMILGSRDEFLELNPGEVHSRFYKGDDSRRSAI